MSDLRDLAADFARAARDIPKRATLAVHAEAQAIESSVVGGSQQIVVTYPGEESAHLGGIDSQGVYDEAQGSSALADTDVHEAAGSLAGALLDAGVGLVMRG